MIAGLRGLVEEVGTDWLLVNVGGVVFQVFVPSSTLSKVSGQGISISLQTHMQMREDGVTLYGFATGAERRMFQLLLGVTGVGPRSALALLSAMSVDDLAAAVASDDTARLATVPGVGKRTAGRIALELKGKLGQFEVLQVSPAASAVASQLVAALTGLGYSGAEASSAVRSIPNLASMEMESALREALRILSSR